MFDKALAPAGRPLGPNPAQPFFRIAGPRDRLTQLVSRLDPRDHHAIGPDIECPLDGPAIEFGQADQRDGVTANGGSQVFDDFFPVEVPVFGVDDHPVQPQRDGHFGDAGGLQGDPQPEDGSIGRQLAAEIADGGDFHESALTDCCHLIITVIIRWQSEI